MSSTTRWDAKSILSTEPMKTPYAVIVLNRPLSFVAEDFLRLWNRATIRVLVDGGANCWFKFISENGLDERVEKPHFLTGDMDSITDESKKRLELLNCQEVPTPDQNDTDCTKAVHVIQPYLESKEIKNVFLLTDFGGRIDQTLSQINTLYKLSMPNDVNVYLWSHETLAWLMRPGQHEILVPENLVSNEVWCSYIPIIGDASVTTIGLKWDLTNTITGFGKIFSSSNTYTKSNVVIHCDKPLLWSMGSGARS